MNKENLANAFIDGSLADTATSVDIKAGYVTYQPTTPYFATITPFGELSTKANSEIVEVTNISSDTLTIVRGQRGTTAKNFSDGAIFSNGIYVEDIEDIQTALDGKVSKVTTVNTLYGVNGSGNQASYLISQASDTSSIAQRSSGGTLAVGTPTSSAHATTKAYVDAADTAHTGNTSNPHSVTKAQVGLGNVDNTSDADKPVSTATQTALNAKANASDTVNLTGDQTIAGIKTFSSSPVVPTATTNTQAVNKDQMDTADSLKVNKAGDTMTGRLISSYPAVGWGQNRGGANISFGTSSVGSFLIYNETISTELLNVLASGAGITFGAPSTGTAILKGTGFPNGVVSAPVGSTYIDTAATNGAIEWKKATGTGNTGWVVSVGDTGRRNITSLLDAGSISGGTAYVRLFPNEVEVSVIGLIPTSANQLILTNIGGVLGTSFTPYTLNSTILTGFGSPIYNRSIIVGSGVTEGIKIHQAGGPVWGSIVYKRQLPDWPSTLPGTAS